MITFGGVAYYIDFKQMDKVVTIVQPSETQKVDNTVSTSFYDANGTLVHTTVVTTASPIVKEIDLLKYETIKTLLEVVLTYDNEDLDTTMGPDRALRGTPLDFQIAFNTLLKEGILKEKNL